MKTTQLKGSMHQSMQQETCGLKKHLLKLAVLVVGVCLLIVVNIDWHSFSTKLHIERPTFTVISNVSKNYKESVSRNDRTAVEQPTFTGISNASKNGVESVSSNNRTAVNQPTFTGISPTFTGISNVSKNYKESVSRNDRTAVEQPTFTGISNVSKNGDASVNSNNRTAVGQPTFTGISNVCKNGVDSVSSNYRTAVEQPTFTGISYVSKNDVDSVSSNNRTAVEQPTFTGISNVSKNGVDSVSSNNDTAGATSKPQFDTSLGINYCKSPLTPITGAEGEIPEGFQLRMVHILFRHGERLSFNGRASKQHTLQDCALNTNVFGSEETLKEFIQTMAKFARKQPPESGFKNYDLLPNEKNCRRPDLTGTGTAQLIKLGEYFREKYVRQSGLFSREISLTNQLYICSSNAARTYKSVIGFLYGFFKSTYFNLTNFNIISSDHNFCSYDKLAQMKCNTKYGAVLRRQMNSRRRSYFLSSASRDFLMSLKDAKTNYTTPTFVGTRIGNYKLFADMISLTYCRNRSKLCLNGQADCLHSSHFDGIWEKLYQENRFVHENSPEAKHYYATYYPILRKIVNRSKDYINGKGNNEKKLFVYGGHETGIFALLHILGLNGGRLTNFASRIVMEFYEASSKTETFIKNKYYFRIFYEGDDITQYVIFCIGKTFRGFCEFSLFYDFVYSKMSQLLRESTFESK